MREDVSECKSITLPQLKEGCKYGTSKNDSRGCPKVPEVTCNGTGIIINSDVRLVTILYCLNCAVFYKNAYKKLILF